MEHSHFLLQAAVYFAAAVLAVMLSHRVGLGSVAGYLLAGIAVGPWGFKLVDRIEDVRAFAELGVVFLLFVIGLELEPQRLWSMRSKLVGLGASQVLGSVAVIVLVAWALGVDPRVALVAAMALSLSSTALALQPLTERGALGTQGGQATFAILLFQDLAVIPMLAVVPLLGGTAQSSAFSWRGLGFAVGAIVATLVLGHFLARPVFRHIARTRLREIFTAFALLLVLGIALLFEWVGLSMALGAFLAGVLLAESEYRHEIEAAIEPFKGLLLGLFFISVGMTVDFAVLFARPWIVVGLIAGLFLLKGVVLLVIARVARLPRDEQPLFVLLVAQGGEFAFVLLGVAGARGAMDAPMAQAITLAVALSMLLTPLVLVLHDRVLLPRLTRADERPPADTPEAARVIVAGLGRVGQVVARLLNAAGIHPTVLDDDPDHVEQSRKFGFRVFYGDATRLDLLHAAGADQADFLIIAIEDAPAISRLARIARANFPRLRIIARAHDMRHSFELRDLGVEVIVRETWLSSLKLGETALALIGGDAERARRAADAFSEHDEEVQAKLYEVHKTSPDAHLTVSNELRDQLARTLSEDERSNIAKR
ncbi:MAG: glutathione-regulated potassium-efflux system ancillary protein KefC [Betaproteobacteria bacterium]|nr:glutathione-regulated potassium-efflux system ancillary protein KefC [Betaproteobacteria bacterium]